MKLTGSEYHTLPATSGAVERGPARLVAVGWTRAARAAGEGATVTEAEWLAATDPGPMLEFLRDKASERKLRLFAVACCRRIYDLLDNVRVRMSVEIAERFAEGSANSQELELAHQKAGFPLDFRVSACGFARSAAESVSSPYVETFWTVARYSRDAAAARAAGPWRSGGATPPEPQPATKAAADAERASQMSLLRDIFGNPFRPFPAVEPTWLAWQEGTVAQLARAAYEGRRTREGTLDPAQLAVLADALEDAGCADAELLGHLRGPGVHVRGCWAVDLLNRKA
jgi:hypothetical protein